MSHGQCVCVQTGYLLHYSYLTWTWHPGVQPSSWLFSPVSISYLDMVSVYSLPLDYFSSIVILLEHGIRVQPSSWLFSPVQLSYLNMISVYSLPLGYFPQYSYLT